MSAARFIVDAGTDVPGLEASDAKHVRVTNVAAWMLTASTGWWVPVNLSAGIAWNAAENAIMALVFFAAFWVNRAGAHASAAGMILVGGHIQLDWAVYWFGYGSGSLAYFPSLIAGGYLLCARRFRWMAHVSALVSVVTVGVCTTMAAELPQRLPLMPAEQQAVVNQTLGMVVLLISAWAYSRMADGAEDALVHEQRRSENLLLNVLPPSIAVRLKAAPEEVIADDYDEVTVLFADLVGFTPMSERVGARATVDVLNSLFSRFDELCEAAGVEKIRTIGDGYMAVCGAPLPNPEHAVVITRVAKQMLEHVASLPASSDIRVRIGLNTGPAVGAIVGRQRFHFDLLGDTVNVAARMESLGEPGRIHIAESTFESIREAIPCEARGVIEVKGKGPMRTWFVADD